MGSKARSGCRSPGPRSAVTRSVTVATEAEAGGKVVDAMDAGRARARRVHAACGLCDRRHGLRREARRAYPAAHRQRPRTDREENVRRARLPHPRQHGHRRQQRGWRHGPRRSRTVGALVATTKATLMNMRGRDMPGWLRVSSGDLRTDDQLAPWVEIGTGYARSLPPK